MRGVRPYLGALVVGVILGLSSLIAAPAEAAPYACNKCEYILFNGTVCHWVDEGESGKTSCNDSGGCILSGNACTGSAGGGGGTGGGGTGGGGGSCGGTGFCPAECFSCPGGGGRPAV